MIVQDRRFHPSSGRVVAYLGNYDPHTKESNFDKEKLQSYLVNGAQPSPRVVKLLKKEKIELPEWVKEPAPKEKATRNPDKRRSTRPEGTPEPETKAPAEEVPAEPEVPAETPEAAEPAVEGVKPEAEQSAEEAALAAETAKTPAEPDGSAEKPAE